MSRDNIMLAEAVTMDDMSADDEFITAAQFEDATRTVVRTIGEHDCDVIFAGTGGKTNSNVVTLPAQDPTKMMTRKQYAVAQGFANAETMRTKCSDVDHFDSEVERLEKSGKKLAAKCAKAIEGVRTERAGQNLYPGMPTQTSATSDYVSQQFLKRFHPDHGEEKAGTTEYTEKANSYQEMITDFKRIGPLAISWRGRLRMGYDSPYAQKAWDSLPKEMQERVDKWCDVVEKIETGAPAPGQFDQEKSYKGCRDALRYAEILAQEIEEIEDEKEKDKDGDGDGAGGAGKKKGKSEKGDKVGHGAARGELEPLDPDMQAEVISLMNEGDDPNTGVRPISTALDVVANKKSKGQQIKRMLDEKRGIAKYGIVKSKIVGRTAVMKRKFERALMTAADTEYVSGQRTGRLDVRKHGTGIMKGRENVYKRKSEGKDLDTALTILVDASGSMGGGKHNPDGTHTTKMELAAQVATAMAECLEGTPVKLEVLCFSTGEVSDEFPDHVVEAYHEAVDKYECMSSSDQRKLGGIFHRNDPIIMWEMKAFDQSLRETRSNFGNMMDLANGANADGDSILFAAKRLKQQKANKHILVVLSDGAPAYEIINGSCHDYTKKVTAYVGSKMGIHLVGVGIMDSNVEKYYKNYTVINELNEMDKAVMDNIARLILGDKFKVDNADVSGIAANIKSMKTKAA